jgi:O-antigen/teichoic acid export membrane protein
LLSVASGLSGQAILIITGVVVARILGVENRGHFALLALGPVVLSNLGFLGMPYAATYYIARDRRAAASVFQTCISLLWRLSLAMLPIHAVAVATFTWNQDESVKVAGFISLLATPGAMASALGLATLQGLQQFRRFSLLRLAQLVPYALGLCLLLVATSASLPLVTLVWTSSMALAGGITLLFAIRAAEKSRSSESGFSSMPLDMIGFGVRVLPERVSPLTTLRVDQILVGILFGPVALGLYVVGTAFSNLPRIIAQSIGMVAYPRIARSPQERRTAILSYVLLTLVTCGFVVITIEAVAGSLVVLFFGSEFMGAATLTRILVLGGLLFGLRSVLADCARGLGRPGLGMTAEFVSWPAFIVSVGLLAPGYGATGVAWSVAISAALGLVVLLVLLAPKLLQEPVSATHQLASEVVVTDAA